MSRNTQIRRHQRKEWSFKDLNQDYLDDVAKGPGVNEELAELFNLLKETGLNKEKVAAKEYPMPENCNMETKQVNPEIWNNIIGSRGRSTDIQIQNSQKLVSKASCDHAKNFRLRHSGKQKKTKKDKKVSKNQL